MNSPENQPVCPFHGIIAVPQFTDTLEGTETSMQYINVPCNPVCPLARTIGDDEDGSEEMEWECSLKSIANVAAYAMHGITLAEEILAQWGEQNGLIPDDFFGKEDDEEDGDDGGSEDEPKPVPPPVPDVQEQPTQDPEPKPDTVKEEVVEKPKKKRGRPRKVKVENA